MYNRETFFSAYRVAFGSLSQKQVEGLEFLLGKLEQDTFSLKQAAYILATIHHETGVTRNGESQRFHPIKELRERATSPRRKNQDRYWLTGYYGRGYVQITWEKNYAKFGIADEPDKALEPETAYEIATRGMREGMFTGRKLSDFINGKADYRNARTIINGHDKADEIAAYARKYEAALIAAQSSAPVAKTADADKGVTTGTLKSEPNAEGTMPPAPAAEVKASQPSLKSTLVAILTFIMGPLSYFGIEPSELGNFAKSNIVVAVKVAVVFGFVVLAVWIWNKAMARAHERTLKVMDAAASQEQNNLRLI